jgi:hypothetical protein
MVVPWFLPQENWSFDIGINSSMVYTVKFGLAQQRVFALY